VFESIDGCEQRIDTATVNGELMLLLCWGWIMSKQMNEKDPTKQTSTPCGQLAIYQLWEGHGPEMRS